MDFDHFLQSFHHFQVGHLVPSVVINNAILREKLNVEIMIKLKSKLKSKLKVELKVELEVKLKVDLLETT